MPTVADIEETVLDAEEIRDVANHYTDWVSAAWLEGVTFFVDTTLDQAIQVQIEGHYQQSNTRPVNVGAVVGLAAGGDSAALGVHRTSTAWLYMYRLRITALVAPTAGSVTVIAIKQLKVAGGA